MTYTFRPRGVCSQEMQVDVDDQGIIQELRVLGGCSGNLQGIASLVKGMPARPVVGWTHSKIAGGQRHDQCTADRRHDSAVRGKPP